MEIKRFSCNVYNLTIYLKHGKYGYFLQDDEGKTYTLYKWAKELLERNELNEKHIKSIIDYVRKNELKKNEEIQNDDVYIPYEERFENCFNNINNWLLR